MTAVAVAIALALGAVMGLLGGGGSILAVPVFTFFLGLPPKEAVVTSLAVIGIAATAGAVSALLRRVVPLGVTLTVGAAATAGAYGGSLIGARLSDQSQLTMLAIVMFIAAAVMWRRPDTTAGRTIGRPMLAALGAAIGAVTGLVGVGGGFLVVPALVIGAGLTMQEAASASLLVIALAAFSGLAGYFAHVAIDWSMVAPFAALAAVGTLAGAHFAGRLPQRRLQQVFATALVIVGVYTLVRS